MMIRRRNLCLLHASRGLRSIKLPILIALIIAFVGCEGEQGPAGPQGPPGESLDLVIEFIGNYPILRADGSSNLKLDAKVSTLAGGNVGGMNVQFQIISGTGTFSSSVVQTDVTGIASCTYTVGTQSGIVTVSASISRSGLTISDTRDLYLDPLAVSTHLLNSDFDEPLMASWSHDGGFVIFQTYTYNDYNLYKVDAQGGDPVHFGNYRGGACKPDGSERIAVFEPPTGNWPEDSKMFIFDYDGLMVGPGARPDAFYGEMRAICWCQNGDSLLIASNTNQVFCVSDAAGGTSRQFEGPVFGKTLSSVLNSPYVVVSGSGEYSGGIYSLNLNTGSVEQLVVGDYWYYEGPAISGASVNSQGTRVVYSARKKIVEEYEEHNDLFTIPFEGGLYEELLASPAQELFPVWSPDDSKVLFCSNRSGSGYNLYIYTVPQ